MTVGPSGQDEIPSAGEPAPVAPPTPAQARRIWLCADDYGIAPGVNKAIRELIARGRLNATSAMVVAPSFSRAAALQLSILNGRKKRVAIGLHLTMTAPFRPLTAFRPVSQDGAFLSIGDMLLRAFLPGFDRALVAREVKAQFDAFQAAFGIRRTMWTATIMCICCHGSDRPCSRPRKPPIRMSGCANAGRSRRCGSGCTTARASSSIC